MQEEVTCPLHSINVVSFVDFVRKNKLSNGVGNKKIEGKARLSLE